MRIELEDEAKNLGDETGAGKTEQGQRLAPCPFCGSRNLDPTCTERESTGARREFYYVMCNRCESSGPTSYERDKAQAMWNRRSDGE